MMLSSDLRIEIAECKYMDDCYDFSNGEGLNAPKRVPPADITDQDVVDWAACDAALIVWDDRDGDPGLTPDPDAVASMEQDRFEEADRSFDAGEWSDAARDTTHFGT